MSVQGQRAPSRAPIVVGVAASIGVVASSLLPWVRTGEVTRSGFALARTLRDAGLADVRFVRPLLIVWFVLPLLGTGAWAALAFVRVRAAALLAVATACVGAMIAAAVLASPVESEIGPPLCIASSVLALVGALWPGRKGM